MYNAFEAPPELVTVADPTPTRSGVVIAVEATGLCRSDWHGWMGHDPDITVPHVPGHELAGTVVACGAEVTNWSEGDRVTLPFVCGCGSCPECASGRQQVCRNQFQPGFSDWGSFAEYVAIEYADHNLVAVPEGMGSTTAAALGCRFVTAFRALFDQGRLSAGEWVAVHGCGGVGLSAVMLATACGARVIATDVKSGPLETARELGAEATINVTSYDGDADAIAAAVADAARGGVALSLDALGRPESCVASVLSLQRSGRHVQVGLLLAEESRPAIPMDRVVAWELELLGSHGIQAHRYPALLRLVDDGRVDPSRLISRSIGLNDAPAALAAMDRFEHEGITVIHP